MKIETINIGSIWAMIVGTAMGILYMFNTFATMDDVDKIADTITKSVGEIELSLWYGQYYDRLDDFDEATDEDNIDLAKEYLRMMEMLEAKICEEDPEWERCKD